MNDPFTIRNLFSHPGPSDGAKKTSPPEPPPDEGRLRTHPGKLRRGWRAVLAFGKWLVVGAEPSIQLTSREQRQKHRRMAVSVGVVVLVLLVVSVGFGWRERRIRMREAAYQQIAGRTEWILSQAQDLSDVSPARARELIVEERRDLEENMKKITDNVLRSRLGSLVDALSEAERSAGKITVKSPDIFLDLNLIRDGTSATAIGSNGSVILLLDAPEQIGLAVSMGDRSGSVIGGGSLLSGSVAMTGDARHAYVLTDHAIVEVSMTDHTATTVVTDTEGAWKRPVQIGLFGGSLYVLDPDASNVYKYPVTDAGFGARRRWFAAGVDPDLTDVVDMQIDGDMWLLHRDGRIERFRQGRAAGFRVSGLLDQFQGPLALSVPADGSRVWILDRGAHRVVALDRETGEYVGQWVFDGVDASGLVVNETLRSIFLLSGSSIYTVQLSP